MLTAYVTCVATHVSGFYLVAGTITGTVRQECFALCFREEEAAACDRRLCDVLASRNGFLYFVGVSEWRVIVVL